MKDNFVKFLFLVVVIGAILFSRFAYPAVSTADLSASTATGQNSSNEAQAFVTPTTAIAASDPLGASDGASPISSVATQATSTVDSAFYKTGAAPFPTLQDEGSLVADLDTGAVFESLNGDVRWPTASLTKLMTATVALDNLSTSTDITITPEMFAIDPDEYTLVVGGRYSVEDLMHVMLMPSSNVAAEAMADFLGRMNFMAEMNARALQWGMNDTYFDDPSGISAANESTPNDMLLLAQKVYTQYPQVLAFTDTPQIYITELNSGKQVLVKSINDFAGEPDFIGGKTGHTDQAEGNLLSIFNYDGHPVIIIVFGTNDRFGDTQKIYAWFKANYK